jgi:hypothetical protein
MIARGFLAYAACTSQARNQLIIDLRSCGVAIHEA